MPRKVGVRLREVLEPSAFEGFVICGDAYVLRDIAAKGFGNGASGVFARLRKEFAVIELPSLALYIVQGLLEGYLLKGLGADIARHGVLHGLEIEEIQRIRELFHKLRNAFSIDDVTVTVQGAVDLAELF